jgi:UPF0271 protein
VAIDLNADMGESFGAWRMGDDIALLDVVSTANVACGFHAGDPVTMTRTVAAAAGRGVAIGAHVSYPDLVGFGRREMELSPEEIAADVRYQLGALIGIAHSVGAEVRHVKPHGALYNRASREPAVALAIAQAAAPLPVMLLAGSPGLLAASTVTRGVAECFADRSYEPDGTLTPRSAPDAVMHDPRAVAERAVRMAAQRRVVARDGSVIAIDAESLCVHGDTPGSVALAREIRGQLDAAGIAVASFLE